MENKTRKEERKSRIKRTYKNYTVFPNIENYKSHIGEINDSLQENTFLKNDSERGPQVPPTVLSAPPILKPNVVKPESLEKPNLPIAPVPTSLSENIDTNAGSVPSRISDIPSKLNTGFLLSTSRDKRKSETGHQQSTKKHRSYTQGNSTIDGELYDIIAQVTDYEKETRHMNSILGNETFSLDNFVQFREIIKGGNIKTIKKLFEEIKKKILDNRAFYEEKLKEIEGEKKKNLLHPINLRLTDFNAERSSFIDFFK
jgi:hypothetical protein